MKLLPAVFEEREIRRVYDEKSETWFFSVVDIVQVLTQQPDLQAARNYWKVLKNRLRKEGSESVTKCNRLKLPAADGKSYVTDVATVALFQKCEIRRTMRDGASSSPGSLLRKQTPPPHPSTGRRWAT